MRLLIAFSLLTSAAFADALTIGPAGIDSKITGLDGSLSLFAAVEIGMAESFRSGKPGYDDPELAASNTTPWGVYRQGVGGMAPPNSFIDHLEEHATMVAGVMIADASIPDLEGVAPGARLHSISIDVLDDDHAALGLNRLATLNNGAVRAINVSYNRFVSFFENDGRSHITRFIDWSARRHDVLYVVAFGNIGSPFDRAPPDNYNGITVAASGFDTTLNRYRWYAAGVNADIDFAAERTWIDLLAPGELFDIRGHGTSTHQAWGTSFAAPHVTGAVALLHQYKDQQSLAGNEKFVGNLRHYVVKAVLMNSADKLVGVHGSNRTILDSQGNTWRDSRALIVDTEPLDVELGAGHLNVRRAVQQFSSGRIEPTSGLNPQPVPMIGWAENVVSFGHPDVEYKIYVLEDRVTAGEWISVTLAWDINVEHTGGLTYNSGDWFFPYDNVGQFMNDLDLYIWRIDVPTPYWVARSISSIQNVEHIFYQFEESGRYLIEVTHWGGMGTTQSFGLAWWYGSGEETIQGDFNGDGVVDAADYTVWRDGLGTQFTAGQYDDWKNNFGAGSGSGGFSNTAGGDSGFEGFFNLQGGDGGSAPFPITEGADVQIVYNADTGEVSIDPLGESVGLFGIQSLSGVFTADAHLPQGGAFTEDHAHLKGWAAFPDSAFTNIFSLGVIAPTGLTEAFLRADLLGVFSGGFGTDNFPVDLRMEGGQGFGSFAAVPEPSAAVLALFGLLLGGAVTRRAA